MIYCINTGGQSVEHYALWQLSQIVLVYLFVILVFIFGKQIYDDDGFVVKVLLCIIVV